MIDSHCHINDEIYSGLENEYVLESQEAGVNKLINIGFDVKSSRIAVEIAEKHEEVYANVGVHPSEVKKTESGWLDKIEDLAKSNKVIGIGEIGLDYYWDKEPEIKEAQKAAFIEQINLANRLDLPISIHCRDAMEDCLNILKEHKVNKGGIMHCFAGSVESAHEVIKLGFILGFGGTLTFKNAVRPKEVIANIPSTAYVLETDSPYLTPEPYRGKPNHSKYIYLVRNKIAELRNISPEQVEKESTENFNRIYNL